MISGIPYFGDDSNILEYNMLNSQVTNTTRTLTLLELAELASTRCYVAVIESKWLSWLYDLTFDYKHKECYIPYFEYEYYMTEENKYKSNNNGHLILIDGHINIRYNYCIKRKKISIGDTITVYNTKTDEKETIIISAYGLDKEFDIEHMYQLYIDSSYKDEEYLYIRHLGGYHTIAISTFKVNNRENKLRNKNGLSTWSIHHDNSLCEEYRDVRQYKYEDIIAKIGIRESIENYKIRRLRFESYLYCSLRSNAIPSDKSFIEEWNKLGKSKDIVKYGKGIVLIFKSYWLDIYRPIKKKSWSRI